MCQGDQPKMTDCRMPIGRVYKLVSMFYADLPIARVSLGNNRLFLN